MSHPRSQHRQHTRAPAKASKSSLKKQLLIVVAVALAFGAVSMVLLSWEHLFPIPPERLVKIYRTHGCRCAFAFADSLRAEGFVVRLYEYETLKYVRISLHTPANLHGCHVAAYLGYFLEGHIAPLALRKLAQQQPPALGLATEDSVDTKREHLSRSIAREEQSRVLLVERDGRARTWFEPPDDPNG